jgi:hypothetical protein
MEWFGQSERVHVGITDRSDVLRWNGSDNLRGFMLVLLADRHTPNVCRFMMCV